MNFIDRFLLLAVFSLAMLLSACVNNLHGGGGGGNPGPAPEQPTQLVTGCYNAAAPAGYLRIDSRDSELAGCPHDVQFNVFIYTPLSGLQPGAELNVCAGDPVPSGWKPWSLPYRDAAGCDSETPKF